MATKSKSKTTAKPAAKRAARRTQAPSKSAAQPSPKASAPFAMPNAAQLAEYAKTLTPEQAFELYRANARLALDVIDAAIESTAKMRRLQFEGEEAARSMQKKAARRAAELAFESTAEGLGAGVAGAFGHQGQALPGPQSVGRGLQAQPAHRGHGRLAHMQAVDAVQVLG